MRKYDDTNMTNMPQADMDQKAEELRKLFKPFDIRYNPDITDVEYPPGLLRKASILIPLFYKDGEYWLILTLRSKDLTHHGGYVAFPGGMADKSDKDEIETALREAEEEIGVPEKDVKIIGLFSPGIVKPNYLVYPVIGLVPADFKPVLNQQEVSMVFHLPLKRFLSKERLYVDEFQSPISAVYHIHHFEDCVQGQTLDTWGMTASYCVMAALVALQSNQKFCFYEQFPTDRENVFSSSGTKHVIQQMVKTMVSKL